MFATFVLGGAMQAQTSAPSPASPATAPATTPSPTPRKPLGWVRFWNMLPAKGSQLELVSAADPNKVISAADSLNVYANYIELPPGRYSLQVFRAGDRQTVLKTLDVPLRDGTYVTVLAHEPVASTAGAAAPAPAVSSSPAVAATPASSPVVIELVEDTPADPAKADNKLTVWQFVPGARVIVSTASKQVTGTLDYGGSQILSGLPNTVSPLVARALTSKGNRIWNSESDFSTGWRSTLLLVNDEYGRFRPRMTNDGPPKPTPKPAP